MGQTALPAFDHWRDDQAMATRPTGRDTVMFVTGLVMVLGAAIAMLLGNEEGSSFATLGVAGIVFIAVSRRPHSRT